MMPTALSNIFNNGYIVITAFLIGILAGLTIFFSPIFFGIGLFFLLKRLKSRLSRWKMDS